MKKYLEALKKLIPDENLSELNTLAEQMVQEVREELDEEYTQKLESAYAQLAQEKERDEKIALKGYAEAYAYINDLKNRLVMQQEEFEQQLENEYEEAFKMIKAVENKNESLAAEVYDEYNGKLNQMKDYIVDKLDEFLHEKGAELYEQARRDILKDPRMAEHKVAFDKIAEIMSQYMDEEEQTFKTSSKLEEAQRKLEDLQGQIKMMEIRNINLDRERTNLKEQVRQAKNIIEENTLMERKERTSKKKTATGRGERFIAENEDDVVVIKESVSKKHTQEVDTDNTLVENLGYSDAQTLRLLAGTVKSQ